MIAPPATVKTDPSGAHAVATDANQEQDCRLVDHVHTLLVGVVSRRPVGSGITALSDLDGRVGQSFAWG